MNCQPGRDELVDGLAIVREKVGQPPAVGFKDSEKFFVREDTIRQQVSVQIHGAGGLRCGRLRPVRGGEQGEDIAKVLRVQCGELRVIDGSRQQEVHLPGGVGQRVVRGGLEAREDFISEGDRIVASGLPLRVVNAIGSEVLSGAGRGSVVALTAG